MDKDIEIWIKIYTTSPNIYETKNFNNARISESIYTTLKSLSKIWISVVVLNG